MNATEMDITRQMFAKQAVNEDALMFALIEVCRLVDDALRSGSGFHHRALLDIRLITKTAMDEVASPL